MKYRWLIVTLAIALLLFAIASCSFTNRSTESTLEGRMLLWHALAPHESQVLQQVISSFTALNPDVQVKTQTFSTTAELNVQFLAAAANGLGPDVIVAPSSWQLPLLAQRAIAPIDEHLTDTVRARFNPAILAMLQSDAQTYGLPLSLDTMSIYVNLQLVESPATTLAALLEQANAGVGVLLPINFIDAFWGIQAFGGQLFNQDGRAILDQGGFANWLAWLREARNAPGMIQDTNRDLLRQRFLAGEAGYYMGYASELTEILNGLGAANVTVIPQPAGPVGPAGPIVTSQAFFFSRVSSTNQRLLATELAKFITNGEQSSRFMRLANYVPANINVRINPRLFPIVAAFATAARSGIPLPTRPEFNAVASLGNEAYIRTLEGDEPPAEVAFSVSNNINEANGFIAQQTPQLACTGLGTIFLAHTWQQPDDIAALEQIIENFRAVCPLVIVELQQFTVAETTQMLTQSTQGGFRASFGLVNQSQLAQLLTPNSQVKSMGALVDADTLQRFTPISLEIMRRQGNLYAVPFTLQTDALYYNRQLVSAPAQTVDDLRAQAIAGTPILLDTNFDKAFWGLRAFGGQLFGADGASLLDQGGMADWLLWLRESRDNFAIQLTTDGDEIRRRFLAGETAYYVASVDDLATLQLGLGENLGVALLPSGPAGVAQPLVQAEGFVLHSDVTDAAQLLAMEFIRYATEAESQSLLLRDAHKIPANASVNSADVPYMAVFLQQAQSGFAMPTTSTWQPVLELGQAAYTDVLANGMNPNTVVTDLAAAINEVNGIVVTPTPTPAQSTSDVLRDEAPTPGEDDADATPTPAPPEE